MAYFISPHGYGHAARAAAVMEAMYGIDPERLEMFQNVSIEGKDFAEEAKTMLEYAESLGPISKSEI